MDKKWWALATVACGTFMATLDSSIVNIALPTLTKSFQTPIGSIKWVVIIYLLTITSVLLPVGRLADTYGRRKLYRLGFFVFTIASVLCGVAGAFGFLVFSRMLQGIGAAMLMANGPAVVTTYFTSKDRGKALGILSMVVSLGLVSGPSLGGFLITHFGWRSIFWVNLPFGLLGMVFAKRYLHPNQKVVRPHPFDWGGAFLQFLILLCILLLVDPPSMNFFSHPALEIPRWILLVSLMVLVWIFYQIEKQVPEAILDFSLFKIRTFWACNLANFLSFVSYSSLFVLMPFYLEEVLNLSPNTAGFYMSAIPLTVFVVAPVAGTWSDRVGSRILTALGASISCLGLVFMSGALGAGLNERTPQLLVVLGLCSVGVASGLFQSPNNNALIFVSFLSEGDLAPLFLSFA
jgi:EmrB/QacA subfamily drug resistance transporter